MEIRRARPDDAGAIAAVHVGTWQAAYAHVFGADRLARLDVDRRRAVWERALAAGDADVFVAEEDGRVVAFASAGPPQDGADAAQGELYSIYALPEAWGGGAASALLRAAVDALRAAGRRDVILWVLEDNPRARRFYEREGWRLDGGRKEGEFLGLRVAEVRYRIAL